MGGAGPRRVVYVIGQLSVGGSENYLASLVQRLNRRCFQPYVVCLSGQDALAREIAKTGCPVYCIDPQWPKHLRTISRLSALLKSINPDIIHAVGRAWYYGIPAGLMAGIPYTVVAERGLAPWKKWYHRRLDQVLLRRAHLGLFNSEMVRKVAWDKLGFSRGRSRVIYSALDSEEFDSKASKGLSQPLPDGVEFSGSAPVICAVANARAVKRLDILISAHQQVLERHRAAQLWIIGDGVLRTQLEDLAKQIGITDQVHFWGLRRDVPAILNRSTLGVLSSASEGSSNALLEYMAAGLPVVATNVGGNPELVVDHETGLLVPPLSEHAMAEAIIRLLDSPDLSRQLGAAGRERVRTNFSMQKMISETEAAYIDLLRGTIRNCS